MSGSEQDGGVRNMKAAALKYNSDRNSAPVVVAAGCGYIAQQIIGIADECGVTIYHDDSAATLLSGLRLGQEVPQELYQMVVDIYLAVMAAAQNSKKPL